MSLIPMLYSDWWDDLERPHSILDQHFGLPLDPDEMMHRNNSAIARHAENLGYPFSRRTRRRHHPFHHALLRRHAASLENKSVSPSYRTDRDTYAISLDVKQFTLDELTVRANDKQNLIFIEARHDEKEDEHGFISRQFTRKYNVPSSIYDFEQIESNLSSDGILTITVPKRKMSGDSNEKIVKIQYTGEPAVLDQRHFNKPSVEQTIPGDDYIRDHSQQRAAHMSQPRGKKINVKGF